MSYVGRTRFSQQTKDDVHSNAELLQKDENGNIVSPNGTGKVITNDTPVDIGHKPGFENRYETEFSSKAGLTQKEHDALFSNPGTLQLEPRDENQSHVFENHDHNDAMQNVSAYAYSQDSDIAANTYINPSEDGNSGTISVVNAQTGEESTVCSYELPGNGDVNGADLSGGNNLNACYSSSDEISDDNADTDAMTDSDDDADTM